MILRRETPVEVGEWIPLITGKQFEDYKYLRLCIGYAGNTSLETGNDCSEFIISTNHSGWLYQYSPAGKIVISFYDNKVQIGTNIGNNDVFAKGFAIYGIK